MLQKTLGYRHDAYLFGRSVCSAGVLYFFSNLNSIFCMVVLVYIPMYNELSFFPFSLKTDIDLKHAVDRHLTCIHFPNSAFPVLGLQPCCMTPARVTILPYQHLLFIVFFFKSPHLIGGGILYNDRDMNNLH